MRRYSATEEQNVIISLGMYDFKPQKRWQEKPDNTELSVSMPPEVAAKVRGVLAASTEYVDYFVDQVRPWQPVPAGQSWVTVETEEALEDCLEELQRSRAVCFQIYNEGHRSYKGFCTWVVFCVPKATYLVDMLRLRASGKELAKVHQFQTQVFEDIRITKVGIDLEQQVLWLQRDFGVFTVNVFDFRQVLKCESLPSDHQKLYLQLFEQAIPKPRYHLSKRPLPAPEMRYVSTCGRLALKIITDCHRLFLQFPSESLRKAYYLSNVLCERQYEHRTMTYEQLLADVFAGKENISQDLEVKLRRLYKWREHVARMHDESLEFIMPNKLMQKILLRGVKSILELTMLYSEWNEKELCKEHHYTVLEMLNEPKERFDPEELQKETDCYFDKPNELFKSLGWNDKEWKTNHFESMKLFKEIISMNVLEPSIIDQELNSTEDRLLSNEQLMCIFNYAQCFNNNDSKLLGHYHGQLMQHLKNHKEEPEDPCLKERFPENFREIYQLANRKKKEMKKEKKRSTEEKEEVFTVNAKDFFRKIGWD